ncbi:MAG: FAD-binding protein [Clostridia bacterium]|nr:FAD-binding protein [Clostridia bacterium]
MLRLDNLSLPLDWSMTTLTELVLRKLRIPADMLQSLTLAKKSVDARDKADVHFVVSVDAKVKNEDAVLKRLKPGVANRMNPPQLPPLSQPKFTRPPVVVGAGPAGLFAALTLAQAGANPILIERGKPVDQRTQDVSAMQEHGILDPDSNVQFGEGGAGAFSDGKLTTGTKSPYIRTVLQTFVTHGAPEEILYLSKPHIGTDKLKGVVASMRNEIIRLGGTVLFETRVTELIVRGSHVEGVKVLHRGEEREILTDSVLLAIGHSARDTMQRLFNQGVMMVQKPFAMGVRIEHPQSLISQSQYGKAWQHPALGAADYKLAVHTPDKRGCYTFCMCPGGEVIAAASQEGGLCVNGMSYHARAGRNANAALLVGVNPEDFGDDHPLAGFVWQRSIEQAAYRLGGGGYKAPVQRVEDLLNGRASTKLGEVIPTYLPGVTPADLRGCLPDFIIEDLKFGIRRMDGQLRGFAHPDAVLTGVETRSSSPVRLNRDRTTLMAEGLDGLFPVGEGAGYAGGIVSAAVDGIVAARAALERSAL